MNKKIMFIMLGIFIFSRIVNNLILPIFADEAIYLRWAGMMITDPRQFMFLPLYDGKSPLFIWMLIPFVKLFTSNPLWGGRLLSSIWGLVTALVLRRIVKVVGGSSRASLIAFALYLGLPFTLFFDRLSLIDTQLTMLLAIMFLFAWKWKKTNQWKYALVTGGAWGLALLTKTSALYVLPVYIAFVGYTLLKCSNLGIRQKMTLQFITAGGLGMLMLVMLRISPLFPFLFNRSSDFAFTIPEIINNPFRILSMNGVRISSWLWWYLSPIGWLATGIGIGYMIWKKVRTDAVYGLLLCGLIFISGFALSGKLLTSRYFLPSVIWFIPCFSLIMDYWWQERKVYGALGSICLLGYCVWFNGPFYYDLDSTHLTADDKRQYLSEWSAGYGISNVKDYLISRVNLGKRVVVATEGYFGTLPDGLFIEFAFTQYLKSMEIFGVGQPVVSVPTELIRKSINYDEAYLLANENRIKFAYSDRMDVIGKYPKPEGGSPLLLLRLKK